MRRARQSPSVFQAEGAHTGFISLCEMKPCAAGGHAPLLPPRASEK